jgi:hypothetical protein
MKKFAKDTILEKILEQEKTKKILIKHRVPCVTCPFARIEMNRISIGEICNMYGVEADELLKELNTIDKNI